MVSDFSATESVFGGNCLKERVGDREGEGKNILGDGRGEKIHPR